jgi:hypothetical protein
MTEMHKHIRDEQFWFTAAVVGFNTLVIEKEVRALPPCFLFVSSSIISGFGLHLILTRWVRDAVDGGRLTAPSFDNRTANACQRARYTFWECRAYLNDFGYVIAEFSGTLFYVLLIIATFVGVVIATPSLGHGWLFCVLSGLLALLVAATLLAYFAQYWNGKLKAATVSGGSASRAIHISGFKRLGIVCSGVWMLVAITGYFLGIYFYPSWLTNALSKFYTWVEGKPEVVNGLDFTPLAPTFNGLCLSLVVLLPVFIGWLVLFVIPRSVRWVRNGFQQEHNSDA